MVSCMNVSLNAISYVLIQCIICYLRCTLPSENELFSLRYMFLAIVLAKRLIMISCLYY